MASASSFFESGVLFLKRLQVLNLKHLHTAILLMLCVKSGIGNGVLAAELTGRNSSFCFTENADYLFVGKTLLHGDHIRRQGQYKGITSIGMY